MSITHCQACIWGLVSEFSRAEGYPNWINDYSATHLATFDVEPTQLEVYAAALYWSAQP